MSTESAHILPHVLIVDDDPDIAKAARLLLERRGMSVAAADGPEAAWLRLAERAADVILLDLNFARGRTGGEEGFALLDRLIAADPAAAVVVVTGHSGIAVAVQAMRGGATDFVIKPWQNERLLATIERAIAIRRARLAAAPPLAGPAEPLLGDSAALAALRTVIARVAPTRAAVLVHGGPGTGKSLVARSLHRDGPLVELEAGLATDLPAPMAGTLLIEGVERLPPALQPDLARLPAGVRVIATSRLDPVALRACLADDAIDRIATIELALPPLAAREGDALLLARHFLLLFAGRHARPARSLGDAAARAVAVDSWPDGVRGLRRAIERAVLLGEGERIEIADLALSTTPGDGPRAIAERLNLADSERMLVEASLKRNAFNVTRAATDLGLTRAALYRRMAKHGL